MVNSVFKRVELKYRLSAEQYAAVSAETERRLIPDAFGETTIQSLYFDTPDFLLARRSIERPAYKEKLRLRCYGLNEGDKDVFLEMKRKVDGVVYKRRAVCREQEGLELLCSSFRHTQIGRELQYFIDFYRDLAPRILILCERRAFFDPESDLRVTFDRRIRCRTKMLDFRSSLEGVPLLPADTVLMELKTGTAFPLWLCSLLSENRICKSSFSKYGAAYELEFRKYQL